MDVIITGKHSQNSVGALTLVVARLISLQRLSLPPLGKRTTCSHKQEGEASTKAQEMKITGSISMNNNKNAV